MVPARLAARLDVGVGGRREDDDQVRTAAEAIGQAAAGTRGVVVAVARLLDPVRPLVAAHRGAGAVVEAGAGAADHVGAVALLGGGVDEAVAA